MYVVPSKQKLNCNKQNKLIILASIKAKTKKIPNNNFCLSK